MDKENRTTAQFEELLDAKKDSKEENYAKTDAREPNLLWKNPEIRLFKSCNSR